MTYSHCFSETLTAGTISGKAGWGVLGSPGLLLRQLVSEVQAEGTPDEARVQWESGGATGRCAPLFGMWVCAFQEAEVGVWVMGEGRKGQHRADMTNRMVGPACQVAISACQSPSLSWAQTL